MCSNYSLYSLSAQMTTALTQRGQTRWPGLYCTRAWHRPTLRLDYSTAGIYYNEITFPVGPLNLHSAFLLSFSMSTEPTNHASSQPTNQLTSHPDTRTAGQFPPRKIKLLAMNYSPAPLTEAVLLSNYFVVWQRRSCHSPPSPPVDQILQNGSQT